MVISKFSQFNFWNGNMGGAILVIFCFIKYISIQYLNLDNYSSEAPNKHHSLYVSKHSHLFKLERSSPFPICPHFNRRIIRSMAVCSVRWLKTADLTAGKINILVKILSVPLLNWWFNEWIRGDNTGGYGSNCLTSLLSCKCLPRGAHLERETNPRFYRPLVIPTLPFPVSLNYKNATGLTIGSNLRKPQFWLIGRKKRRGGHHHLVPSVWKFGLPFMRLMSYQMKEGNLFINNQTFYFY